MDFSWLKQYDIDNTAELEPEEAAVAINEVAGTPTTKLVFGSFRTFAALLTPTEYNALRATFKDAVASEASQGGSLYADMERILLTPGDDAGSGGGLALNDPGFVTAMAAMCQGEVLAAVPEKINAYVASYQPAVSSLAAEHGFANGVAPAQIRRVRTPAPEPPVDGGDDSLPPLPPVEE